MWWCCRWTENPIQNLYRWGEWVGVSSSLLFGFLESLSSTNFFELNPFQKCGKINSVGMDYERNFCSCRRNNNWSSLCLENCECHRREKDYSSSSIFLFLFFFWDPKLKLFQIISSGTQQGKKNFVHLPPCTIEEQT